jgi:tellurite resistance protein
MTDRLPRQHHALATRALIADYLDEREEQLLDAVITTAALVARADGWIEPVERSGLLEFLGRNGLLSATTRDQVLDAFERRLRQFEERDGARIAAECLKLLAGHSAARLVLEAGKQVALADGHLHPREAVTLQLVRIALRPRSEALQHAGRRNTK